MSLATQLTVGCAASVMRVLHSRMCVSLSLMCLRGHLMEQIFGPAQICSVPCHHLEKYKALLEKHLMTDKHIYRFDTKELTDTIAVFSKVNALNKTSQLVP